MEDLKWGGVGRYLPITATERRGSCWDLKVAKYN